MSTIEHVDDITYDKYPVGAFRIRYDEPVGVVTASFDLLRKCVELLQGHTITGPHKVPFRRHNDACAVIEGHAVISAELSVLNMAGIRRNDEEAPSICIGTTEGDEAQKEWDVIDRTGDEVFEKIHDLLRQLVDRNH